MARPRNDAPTRFTCDDCQPGAWCEVHRREERLYKRDLRRRQGMRATECLYCMGRGHSPDFCPLMEAA